MNKLFPKLFWLMFLERHLFSIHTFMYVLYFYVHWFSYSCSLMLFWWLKRKAKIKKKNYSKSTKALLCFLVIHSVPFSYVLYCFNDINLLEWLCRVLSVVCVLTFWKQNLNIKGSYKYLEYISWKYITYIISLYL